jgi:hypothetical protein
MLRALRVARQTALKARTQATNGLRALLVTAPAQAVPAAPGTVEDRPAPRGRRP